MTKEVAEKIVRGITDKIECNTVDIDDWAEFWGFTIEDYEELLYMAIKALEQEPILDKIRAEIETLNPVDYVSMSSYEGHRGASDMKDDVLQTIDKYKAESRGIK